MFDADFFLAVKVFFSVRLRSNSALTDYAEGAYVKGFSGLYVKMFF